MKLIAVFALAFAQSAIADYSETLSSLTQSSFLDHQIGHNYSKNLTKAIKVFPITFPSGEKQLIPVTSNTFGEVSLILNSGNTIHQITKHIHGFSNPRDQFSEYEKLNKLVKALPITSLRNSGNNKIMQWAEYNIGKNFFTVYRRHKKLDTGYFLSLELSNAKHKSD